MELIDSAVCGNVIYNPLKQMCYKDVVYERRQYGVCGQYIINRSINFCFDGRIYSREYFAVCIGKLFSQRTHKCVHGTLIRTFKVPPCQLDMQHKPTITHFQSEICD